MILGPREGFIFEFKLSLGGFFSGWYIDQNHEKMRDSFSENA